MDLEFVKKVNELCDCVPGSWESGDRTPTHNHNVGGAPSSQHLLGKALDLVYDNTGQLLQAARKARDLGFLGIEVDFRNNHLHVDGRSNPWMVVYTKENTKGVDLDTYLKSLEV